LLTKEELQYALVMISAGRTKKALGEGWEFGHGFKSGLGVAWAGNLSKLQSIQLIKQQNRMRRKDICRSRISQPQAHRTIVALRSPRKIQSLHEECPSVVALAAYVIINTVFAVADQRDCKNRKTRELVSIGQMLERGKKGDLRRALIQPSQGRVIAKTMSGEYIVAAVPESSQSVAFNSLNASSVDTAFDRGANENVALKMLIAILLPIPEIAPKCPTNDW